MLEHYHLSRDFILDDNGEIVSVRFSMVIKGEIASIISISRGLLVDHTLCCIA